MKPVDAITHPDEHRALIPTTETQGEETGAIAQEPQESDYNCFRHIFGRGRDPELYWLNKYRNDDEQTQPADMHVDIRSLYRHEQIEPEALINQLYRSREEEPNVPRQNSLFDPEPYDENILERVAKYYHHQTGWQNRLIQGDSLLVMNSLLKREGMAGQVQTIYIDPPYGIKFGSNWQLKLNSRDVKEGDDGVSSEPEMIKAFRDTWELGIHSYLSYLRDRLILARELLTTSGSVFVQISDENVHLVRSLLDEVFGSENFVSQIIYQKTTSAGSPAELKAPASLCDYIIWYAKDKENIKYRKLFLPKEYDGNGGSGYNNIELSDGRRMTIKQYEKETGKKFKYEDKPSGAKLFAFGDITSQHGVDKTRYDIEINGKTFTIRPPKGWRTSKEGMNKLIKANRVAISDSKSLSYIRYFEDFPAMDLPNLWTFSNLGSKKLFVVQTAIKPIQRCILMTTDPGDLVLDPTCGSGTTAYVAEQWGRRWITIDTSRIALNIAKTRLTTALFPYYTLHDEQTGNIRLGFKYKTVPHITLKSLANGLPPQQETLYDQPEEDRSRIRVAGPFTVETLQSYNVLRPEEVDDLSNRAEEDRLFRERIFAHLTSAGIRNGDKKQQAVFHSVEATTASPWLHARGWYKDGEGKERLAYFHIGPKFGTVSRSAVNEAIKEFRDRCTKEGASWLVLLGFSFEDSINDRDYNLGTFTVSKVRMHDDLMQEGLLKKDRNAGSFITIGEPDIALIDDGENKYHIEIRGLDIYDPIRDDVHDRPLNQIGLWEIDTRYNGELFVVRELHFTGGDRNEFAQWQKGLSNIASDKTKTKAQRTLRIELSDEIWDTLYDFRSSSFEAEPGSKICVRVVSLLGEESSKVLVIPSK